MRTLDRWVDRLTELPRTIECPQMQVLGRDHEPPLFTGSGNIRIHTRTKINFVMHATPRDGREAFKRMARAQQNPYSIHDQFRLLATEYDGTEWNGGWTGVRLGETSAKVWRLSGALGSLVTRVSGRWVGPDSSVELIYDTPLRLPTPMNMVTTVTHDGDEVFWSRRRGRKMVDVVGTCIEFSHAAEGELIWAAAKTTAEFPHPHAENWISEPLRLLLGQLVFPRLVARNRGDGTAMVWLRPSPPHTSDVLVSSILGDDPHASSERFWGLYRDILTMVVNGRDEGGHRNFDAHPLTPFYQEIAQATTGSHWVLCMTLTSTAEGIAAMLAEPEERRSEFDPAAIEELRDHIKAWPGDENLRSRILDSVAYAGGAGIAVFLRGLSKKGILEPEQVSTWSYVRNRVMHGNLISPWPDRELEQRLQLLTGLLHRLSAAYIRKCVSNVAGYEPYV